MKNAIQKTVQPKSSNQLQCIENPEENETLIALPTKNWSLIENEVHCFYPEKIMRAVFRNDKILSATHDKQVWK